MKVKVTKLREDAIVPQYQTDGSAGVDLHAIINRPRMVLRDGETQMISTGLAIEIPDGYEGQVRSRSGLSIKGIMVANSPGTIDSDYRGELKVILKNSSSKAFIINRYDRVAQLVFCPVAKAEFEITEELSETDRGAGGFGSTGV